MEILGAHREDPPAVPPQGYNEYVFADGESYFASLLQDIAQATSSIDLECYIFQRDHLGKRVAQALMQAAQRGVTVRVLVDGAGSPLWTTSFARQLEKVGASTKVFHPFPWHLWNWSRSVVRVPTLLKWIYLILKINYRNHRKVCILDKKIVYAGSINITRRHLSLQNNGDFWRDTAVRVSETDLTDLQNSFDCAWEERTTKEKLRDTSKHIRKDPVIRVNHTRYRRRLLYKHLLRKIKNSTERIWITNAYFVPDNFLLKHLRDAAYRGIDVRILLPKKSDIAMMPWASCTFYHNLLRSGVRIFEYLPSNLHAKTLIVDDWILVGSSNLNHRSLLHDLEVDIKMRHPENKKFLQQLFLDDLSKSQEISLTSLAQMRPFRHRFLGRFVLYLKYWI